MYTSKVSATQNPELSLFDGVEKTTPPQPVADVTVINQQEVLGKTFKIYGTFETPLFLAKDVAKVIEYNWESINKMLKNLDDEEKVKKHYTPLGSEEYGTSKKFNFGTNEAWFVTENGVYELMFLVKTPLAKEFKKEVKKILHEIRTTGTFRVPRTMKEALQIALEQQEKIEAQQKLLEEQKPKVELHDKAINADGTFSMDQVASLLKLGYGNITLFRKLRELGILCHDNTPKQEQENAGRFKVVTKTIVKGDKTENTPVTRVTFKGLEYIAKKLGVIFDSSSLEVLHG